MLKILVADSAIELGETIANAFEGRYAVSICDNGIAALESIRIMCPDILWLDLMLPGMDGLMILQMLSVAGLRPKVIACSGYISNYIEQTVNNMGVSCLLRKPCSIEAALLRIEDVARLLQDGDEVTKDLEQLFYYILLPLGLTGKRVGHRFLLSALRQKVMDSTQQITKALYPAVAAEYGGSSERVERAIRGVLGDAWTVRNQELWSFYFPDDKEKCPSNGAFIERIANYIRQYLEKSEVKKDVL